MASKSKDNLRKDGAEKSSAKKTSKVQASASKKDVLKSSSSSGGEKKEKVKKGAAKTKVSSEPATSSHSIIKSSGKKIVEKLGLKKAAKSIRDFMDYLDSRYPLEQKIPGHEQAVLEHLAFAIFLEYGSFKQARYAFSEILKNFVDWNETRVARVEEIVGVVGDIPKAVKTSEHLRWLLQNVFNASYDFNLEGLRQQSETETRAFFHDLPIATRFVTDYVEFFALGGKDIPLSPNALRVLRLLGFVKVENAREELDVRGRALTQEETRRLFFQLHELGAEYQDETKRQDVVKFLKGFDKKVEERSDESTIFDESERYDSMLALYLEEQRRKVEAALKSKGDDRKSNDASAYDGSSDFDDEVEEFDSDSDSCGVNESVAETKMSSEETSYRETSASSVSDLSERRKDSFRGAGKRSSSSEPSGRATSKALRKKSKGDLEEDSESDASSKKSASESKTKTTTSKRAPAGVKSARQAKTTQADEDVVPKAEPRRKASSSERATSSRRGGVADSSNVSSSEPPDNRRRGSERTAKAVRSTSDLSSGDQTKQGKDAKRTKTKDASKKSSSKDASKLKEIQKRKPR